MELLCPPPSGYIYTVYVSLQVGPVAHGDGEKTSPETQKLIDDEVKRLLKVH